MFCDDANQLLEAFKEEFNIKKKEKQSPNDIAVT